MGCNCRKQAKPQRATRPVRTRVVYAQRGVQVRKPRESSEQVDKKVRRIGEQ